MIRNDSQENEEISFLKMAIRTKRTTARQNLMKQASKMLRRLSNEKLVTANEGENVRLQVPEVKGRKIEMHKMILL